MRRQEDQEFIVILYYIVSYRLAWAICFLIPYIMGYICPMLGHLFLPTCQGEPNSNLSPG